MAGHSKWSKVKYIKGSLDLKRGQLFSRLAKEITVAARMGGGDSSGNPRLRSVILAARAQSMPRDEIERAMKRGTGEGVEAANLEVARDNCNRTAADLRLLLTKNHGSLVLPGAMSYLFHRKGRVTVPATTNQEEPLFDLVIEAGGEELAQEHDDHVITTAPDKFYAVAEALEIVGVQAEEALAQLSI